MNNKKHAPHLPVGTVTEWQKERWKRIIWLCVTVICSAAAGAVASLWVIQGISSILPQSNGQTTIIVSNDSTPQEEFSLDPLVSAQVSQRIVHVLNENKQINGFVEEDAFIGQAVVLNAGGWAVLYNNPDVVNTKQWKNWRVVDFQGKTYKLVEVISDSRSGLVYIHIDGEHFRGDLRFADLNQETKKRSVFAAIGKKQSTPITIAEFPMIPKENRVDFSTILKQYPITGSAAIGDPIMNPAGEFVGFVNTEKQLLGSWAVSHQLSSILKERELTISDLTIGVTAVHAQDDVPRAATQLGYYVESIQGVVQTSSTLNTGDVIIAIDGQPVESIDIAKTIQLANRALDLRVIRRNETKHIEVSF